MPRSAPGTFALAALLAFALAACAPTLGALGLAGPPTELVVLPTGERCAHAGDGATLALDGDRLSWTCEPEEGAPRGLLGTPSVSDDGTGLTWRLGVARTATTGGFELARDEFVSARVLSLEFADGVRCAFAGEGATFAFEGRRVAYTCDADAVVLSPLETDGRGVLATRATVVRGTDGFETSSPRRLRAVRVSHEDLSVTVPSDGTWALRRAVLVGGAEVAPADPQRYTLAFLPDGSAAIRADCNRGVGQYETSGARLTFAPFALTRAMCPADSLDTAFVALLTDTEGYTFDGETLRLTTAAGDTLEFVRAAD
jgi:heat shock protein HslJ